MKKWESRFNPWSPTNGTLPSTNNDSDSPRLFGNKTFVVFSGVSRAPWMKDVGKELTFLEELFDQLDQPRGLRWCTALAVKRPELVGICQERGCFEVPAKCVCTIGRVLREIAAFEPSHAGHRQGRVWIGMVM